MSFSDRPTTEAQAIEWLVARTPELAPVVADHLRDYDELLAYVVFESDFLQWLTARVKAGDLEPAQRFVSAVEWLMTTDVDPPADDRVWNLAGVCFVEGLVMGGQDDIVAAARPWMGPNTEAEIDKTYEQRSDGNPHRP